MEIDVGNRLVFALVDDALGIARFGPSSEPIMGWQYGKQPTEAW